MTLTIVYKFILQGLQPDPSKKTAYDDAFERHQRLSNALFEKQP